MKIVVVGAGAVGVSTCHYVLARHSECNELVLIDKDAGKAEGEMLDFGHVQSLTFSRNVKLIGSGEYKHCANADVVVITAGAQLKPEQSRLDLAEVNCQIAVSVAQQVEAYAPNAILLVVTNPCDIATYFILRNTTYPPERVMSTGCIIDSARLRKLVGSKTGVDPKNVNGYILGEHGSNCILPWHVLSVDGQHIDEFCKCNGMAPFNKDSLLADVKKAAFDIIFRKGNTAHGIAASISRIIQAISVDENTVLPVGTLVRGQYGISDIVLSLPTVVGRRGAIRILSHPFSESELSQLRHIANTLYNCIMDVAAANTEL